jgi:hypothetical protein
MDIEFKARVYPASAGEMIAIVTTLLCPLLAGS